MSTILNIDVSKLPTYFIIPITSIYRFRKESGYLRWLYSFRDSTGARYTFKISDQHTNPYEIIAGLRNGPIFILFKKTRRAGVFSRKIKKPEEASEEFITYLTAIKIAKLLSPLSTRPHLHYIYGRDESTPIRFSFPGDVARCAMSRWIALSDRASQEVFVVHRDLSIDLNEHKRKLAGKLVLCYGNIRGIPLCIPTDYLKLSEEAINAILALR